nr:excalibur calcium-binding domain-containing protein [Aeromonas dhakensis]
MRYQGRIVRWNEARGFGFIAPEQGEGAPKGAELFVHISALKCDGLPPMAGERVSYLVGAGQDGKPRAEQVFFPERPLSLADGNESRPIPAGRRMSEGCRIPAGSGPTRSTRVLAPPTGAAATGAASSSRCWCWSGSSPSTPVFSAESVSPTSTSSFSQAEADSSDTPQQTANFVRQCDGRQYCSQMTSCEEATWFLRNCPNTRMDGEGDGIPCERQWCGH